MVPLEPLENSGSVYGYNTISKSPKSAMCTRQLCFVATLENIPMCMSDREVTLTASQFHGHINRMNDSRPPKAVVYGELAKGKHLHVGQRLQYKDVVQRHLKATHIAIGIWETLTKDRQ